VELTVALVAIVVYEVVIGYPSAITIHGLCHFQEMKFFLPLISLLSQIKPSLLCMEIRVYLPIMR
jgi:hypothetical protein